MLLPLLLLFTFKAIQKGWKTYWSVNELNVYTKLLQRITMNTLLQIYIKARQKHLETMGRIKVGSRNRNTYNNS